MHGREERKAGAARNQELASRAWGAGAGGGGLRDFRKRKESDGTTNGPLSPTLSPSEGERESITAVELSRRRPNGPLSPWEGERESVPRGSDGNRLYKCDA